MFYVILLFRTTEGSFSPSMYTTVQTISRYFLKIKANSGKYGEKLLKRPTSWEREGKNGSSLGEVFRRINTIKIQFLTATSQIWKVRRHINYKIMRLSTDIHVDIMSTTPQVQLDHFHRHIEKG